MKKTYVAVGVLFMLFHISCKTANSSDLQNANEQSSPDNIGSDDDYATAFPANKKLNLNHYGCEFAFLNDEVMLRNSRRLFGSLDALEKHLNMNTDNKRYKVLIGSFHWAPQLAENISILLSDTNGPINVRWQEHIEANLVSLVSPMKSSNHPQSNSAFPFVTPFGEEKYAGSGLFYIGAEPEKNYPDFAKDEPNRNISPEELTFYFRKNKFVSQDEIPVVLFGVQANRFQWTNSGSVNDKLIYENTVLPQRTAQGSNKYKIAMCLPQVAHETVFKTPGEIENIFNERDLVTIAKKSNRKYCGHGLSQAVEHKFSLPEACSTYCALNK